MAMGSSRKKKEKPKRTKSWSFAAREAHTCAIAATTKAELLTS